MGNTSTTLRAAKGELPRQLEDVVGLVADRESAQALREVFSLLIEMSEALPPVEEAQRLTQEQGLAALASVNEDALSLADHIDWMTERQAEGDEVAEALSGVGFALRHEAGRLSGLYAAEEGVGAELLHDLGLMSNCLRQCVRMLALAIDPQATVDDPADEEGRRLRESVALRDGLQRLIESLSNRQGNRYPQSALTFFDQIEEFRRECLPYLMHRDWPTFEGFADEIVMARDQREFDRIGGRFRTYLETLLRHVQMRAALTGQPAASAAPRASFGGLLRRATRPQMIWSAALSALVIACCVFLTRAAGSERTAAPGLTHAAERQQQEQGQEQKQGPRQQAPGAAPRTTSAAKAAEAGWSLQLGAYGERRRADELAARLRSGRVEARVVETAGQGGRGALYRVRAGGFATREAAEAAGRALRAEGRVQNFVAARGE